MMDPVSGTRVKVTKPIYVTEDRDACLYAHNKVRSYHDVGMLIWDPKLARDAKNRAIYLMENDLFDHVKGYGENLYRMPCDTTFHRAYQAVHFFYKEIESYDFSKMSKPNSEMSEAEFDKVGHFTQVVWKDTTKVGCCVAFDNESKETIIVCRYSIAQSYDYSKQVLPQHGNGKLFIPKCEDLIWENDVKPTIQGVDHYIML